MVSKTYKSLLDEVGLYTIINIGSVARWVTRMSARDVMTRATRDPKLPVTVNLTHTHGCGPFQMFQNRARRSGKSMLHYSFPKIEVL